MRASWLVVTVLLLAGCTSSDPGEAMEVPAEASGALVTPSGGEPVPATPPPEPVDEAEPAAEPDAPVTSPPPERAYEHRIERDTPIVLRGDTVMLLDGIHFVQRAPITLDESALLVVRNARLDLSGTGGLLQAQGEARVVLHNAEIGLSCEGTVQWTFIHSASLEAETVIPRGCGAQHHFSGASSGTVHAWPTFSATACEEAHVQVEASPGADVARC